MELLSGQSLGHWARTGIDLPRALAVLVQICDGLAAAHDVGVIHRDLKPDNVFIVPTTDGAELVKLLDFGVAKLVNRDDEDLGFQTAAGSVIGTPAYMSPEQAGGMPVDPRSDIYSLGAIMHELFCGQPMFQGRSFGEYVRKHLVEMPPPPRATPGGAQLDPRIDALIMKCLEKEPDQRFAAIGELRDALLALLGGMETYLPGLAALGQSGVRLGASLCPARCRSRRCRRRPRSRCSCPRTCPPCAPLEEPRGPRIGSHGSHAAHASGAHPPQAAYPAPSSPYAAQASLPPLYGASQRPRPRDRRRCGCGSSAARSRSGSGPARPSRYAGRGDSPAQPRPDRRGQADRRPARPDRRGQADRRPARHAGATADPAADPGDRRRQARLDARRRRLRRRRGRGPVPHAVHARDRPARRRRARSAAVRRPHRGLPGRPDRRRSEGRPARVPRRARAAASRRRPPPRTASPRRPTSPSPSPPPGPAAARAPSPPSGAPPPSPPPSPTSPRNPSPSPIPSPITPI